jgi:2-polyprenyl-6-methoxyphenol hydroxylase-like FAD-dependent oxidoreductase
MTYKSKVLISGAGIAGPALAYWLDQYGFDVTVVERAPAIRPGGQAVDFKGATHRTVLERMGIRDAVWAMRAPVAGDGMLVDATGRQVGTMPAAFGAGDVEIVRGDLARILYERTAPGVDYLFGETIASLTETANGVAVAFGHAAPRTFDLVVGADGMHSNVRALAFGPASDYVRHLGYYYALASIDCDASRADRMYNEPGRMVATGGPQAPSLFVFASKPLVYARDDVARQKQLLAAAFAGSAWNVPALMQALPPADDFYMDAISRVTVDRFAQGRIALLGDAAWGNALGGFGTGLALVGAYVLAGELRRAKGNYRQAYAQYEAKFRPYAKVAQKVNAGTLLAPATRWGLYLRNRLFSVAPLFAGVMKVMDHFATDIELDDYARDA